MKLFKIVISALFLTIAWSMAADNNPIADSRAQVISGNARFTILTDRLIRMEWAEDRKFEDHATLAVVNRCLPVPEYKVSRIGDNLTIRTSSLVLVYQGSDRFDENNLSVSFKMKGKTVEWNLGSDDSGNLMGTARTLDGCQGADKINNNDPMEKGIISREGWAVVDESGRHIFEEDSSDWGEWVYERPYKDAQDLYLFAYGHDYKSALRDFTKIAGKIPMPPKYVFGYWWSRFKAYSDEEFLELASEFRTRRLPIDIMVIDMDWHETWQRSARKYRKDEFGQGIGWTGYSWNRDLFADPEGFLNELHSMKIKTSLNLHPASGISPREDSYSAFVEDYLSRNSEYDGPEGYVYKGGESLFGGKTAKAGYHAPVPFRMSQKSWANAYFQTVIHPLEKQGIDFWWLDWQQWKQSKYLDGLSNTFWLNYTFFNDKVRMNRGLPASEAPRPMTYHRWGGLGSHRYQIGFSGDTHIMWSVLAYLPYFTATASNVGYGYWGHDLGGHMQRSNDPTDPELYTRWLQYGVFSPLFKTHCTSSDIIERRFWMFPEHYEYMKQALELRYSLTPYIYDAARQAYDTGVSICRPMYYSCPEDDEAYLYKEQYMFGDNILAATICTPVDKETGLAERKVWLPDGGWYDMAHKKLLRGGRVHTVSYSIAENAWFVRAGSIVPMAKQGIQNLQDKSNELRLFVAPGYGKSSYTHYEDDEESQAYDSEYAITKIAKTSTSKSCSVTIFAREGKYKGIDPNRNWTLLFGGLDKKPSSVEVSGVETKFIYDADAREAVVSLGSMPTDREIKVTVVY